MQMKSKQVPTEAAHGERKGPGRAVQWASDQKKVPKWMWVGGSSFR